MFKILKLNSSDILIKNSDLTKNEFLKALFCGLLTIYLSALPLNLICVDCESSFTASVKSLNTFEPLAVAGIKSGLA